MCLAIPAKVVEIHGDVARVDFGAGTTRDVNVALVEAKVGESRKLSVCPVSKK